MYNISKEFSFSASHKLNGLPPDHPCSRLHGHNYTVILHLQSDVLDDIGFVTDYRALDSFKKWIDSVCDHRDLNEVFPGINPTAENLALIFFQHASQSFLKLIGVSVKETEKTIAHYSPWRN